MKNKLSTSVAMAAIIFLCYSWTTKGAGLHSVPPAIDAPTAMVGGWANGFTTFTQIVDAYNGRILGSTWQSGKYFKFTADGKACQFYIMGKSQYSSYATQATGTVSFDPGSTNSKGSFTFTATAAHYKGWGSVTVDRDATASELKNNLSRRYYYRMDGEWLRIDPSGEPNDYSSSFKKVN
ncbi:MAG TPA: hypothetical protein VM884_05120 [Flavisolibacter sp.]|jgi:hypothetical protein|nr:hypothetical protein [Flavisolibacter sp.]